MSDLRARLDRLQPGLMARERAVLVLRSWKEGKEEDPLWRWSMPPEQAKEFNRYIGLMNGVNRNLFPYVLVVCLEVDKLSLRLVWLGTFALWGIQAWQLGEYIMMYTREPVMESEYRKLVEEARAELKPARELADHLVERYDEWEEDDLEPGERLLVHVGSFYDWLGEELMALPDWGLEYEVIPDAEVDDGIRGRRQARQQTREAFEKAPLASVYRSLEVAGRLPAELREPRSETDKLVEAKKIVLRDGVQEQWRELLAQPGRSRRAGRQSVPSWERDRSLCR